MLFTHPGGENLSSALYVSRYDQSWSIWWCRLRLSMVLTAFGCFLLQCLAQLRILTYIQCLSLGLLGKLFWVLLGRRIQHALCNPLCKTPPGQSWQFLQSRFLQSQRYCQPFSSFGATGCAISVLSSCLESLLEWVRETCTRCPPSFSKVFLVERELVVERRVQFAWRITRVEKNCDCYLVTMVCCSNFDWWKLGHIKWPFSGYNLWLINVRFLELPGVRPCREGYWRQWNPIWNTEDPSAFIETKDQWD